MSPMMTPDVQHHPADDLLLAQAGGQLPMGAALLVASHAEVCAQCAERLRQLQALGGVLLEELPAASMQPDALARALAAIDAPAPVAAKPPARGLPPLPAGASWPRAMAGCTATRWRWIGPGMYFSRVQVPADPAANVFLLRIGAGKYLPRHSHSDWEMTQILHGSFHDGRAHFGPGDFDVADGEVHHQPVVQAGSECICLAAVQGRVLFEGFIARRLGALVGM
ncbi:ChrR family anti-sigma-E factor [Xenophilus arseniciresistens]|uniref:ChrR family anti-sigma-E factor n=1 Tax=Xenophilus arseniciresistens TaxID=1283306 RepID=A0AAE3SX89_9BURK|nr:ChrR family anti-sigma-E factor [Xenophilus arseniciresistens]MDA7414887.1 ChrR family anti-sigma-E factor [Xenophilus arseniciresistens]